MWRLRLDTPYTFQTRPPAEKAQHAIDFSLIEESNTLYVREAGLLLLRPSCFRIDAFQHLIASSQINKATAHWREARRLAKGILVDALQGSTQAGMLTRVRKQGEASIIELLIEVAIVALTNRLKWVLQTAANLEPDESFAIYLQCQDDELANEDDYLYLQWYRWGLRFDTAGGAALYRYGEDLQQQPKLIYRWQFADALNPREMRAFVVIPAPPLGFLVGSYKFVAPSMHSSSTSRELASLRLVPIPAEYLRNIGTSQDPIYSYSDAAPLNIGLNLRYDPVIGVERVRYPTSGYAIDAPFPVGWIKPKEPYHEVQVLRTHKMTASSEVQDTQGNAWTASTTDGAARVKMTLTTDNPVYTPFVAGYYAYWEPEYAARDTTPITPTIKSLEWTSTELAQGEGEAQVIVESSDATPILRGDMTFTLDRWDGTQWVPHEAGFAAVETLETLKQPYRPAPTYRAVLSLKGMWARLLEIFQHSETAFDYLLMQDAFNKLLQGAGFEPLTSVPAPLQNLRMPAAQMGGQPTGWRYMPRVGQTGYEILQTLLLLCSATGQEYRLRYDATQGKFALEAKPNPDEVWTLSPVQEDATTRTVRYSTLEAKIEPPEANIVRVEGATAPEKDGKRIVYVKVNQPSIDDPSSPEYLGRVRFVRLASDNLRTAEEVQQMANRLYQVATRRIRTATLTIPDYEAWMLPLLTPPVRANLVLPNNGGVWGGWIKRATLMIEEGNTRVCSLRLLWSDMYESDPRE